MKSLSERSGPSGKRSGGADCDSWGWSGEGGGSQVTLRPPVASPELSLRRGALAPEPGVLLGRRVSRGAGRPGHPGSSAPPARSPRPAPHSPPALRPAPRAPPGGKLRNGSRRALLFGVAGGAGLEWECNPWTRWILGI